MNFGMLFPGRRRRQNRRVSSPVPVDRITTHVEYVAYLNAMALEHDRRRHVERSLIVNDQAFQVEGQCFVCRRRTSFRVDFSHSYRYNDVRIPNWREHLTCPRCGLNNRMRAAVHLFEQECSPGTSSDIYLTEQCTPLFQVLRAKYPRVIGSEYLGDTVPYGSTDDGGLRNESITKLSFPSGVFDFILSFDIFEHVPEYSRGFAECRRCLKPGGTLLFTVPMAAQPETLVRARSNSDGTISHLLPPEYHGDPLNADGCLCFYHFGWDLLDRLGQLGFRDTQALGYWSREFGYLGDGVQLLFCARTTAA